jgi:hypothetical protein
MDHTENTASNSSIVASRGYHSAGAEDTISVLVFIAIT